MSEPERDEGDDYGDEDETYYDSEQCLGCGASIFCEEHDWDCPYAEDDDDVD